MIIKGLEAIEKHMASLHAKDVLARPWMHGWTDSDGYDHDEDMFYDVLFDVPNR